MMGCERQVGKSMEIEKFSYLTIGIGGMAAKIETLNAR
jgi:hypothetical protein